MTDYEAIIEGLIQEAEGRIERDRKRLDDALREYAEHTPVYIIQYYSTAMTADHQEIKTLQKVLRRGEGFD